jgi:hypothetical protein
MKNLIIVASILVIINANAQVQKDSSNIKFDASFSAQFLVSTDIHSIYFNYVGAGVKYAKGKNSLSITVFPAFRYVFDKERNEKLSNIPNFYPGLAVGLLFQHKKWLIGTPVFYSGAEAKWNFTLGLGYSF